MLHREKFVRVVLINLTCSGNFWLHHSLLQLIINYFSFLNLFLWWWKKSMFLSWRSSSLWEWLHQRLHSLFLRKNIPYHFRSWVEQSLQEWFFLQGSAWKQFLQQIVEYLPVQVNHDLNFGFKNISVLYQFAVSNQQDLNWLLLLLKHFLFSEMDFYWMRISKPKLILVKVSKQFHLQLSKTDSCCRGWLQGVWVSVLWSSVLGHPGSDGPHVHCDLCCAADVLQVKLVNSVNNQQNQSIFRAQFSDNRSIFNTPNPRLMNASLLKGDTKLFTDFLKITKTGKYFSFPLINHLERTTKPMYF